MARSRKVETEPVEVVPLDVSRGGTAWKWLAQFALPLLAGAALVGGLLWAGRQARDRLRQQGGHTFAIADVQCDPPPGLTRQQFLEEAQYLSRLPDRLNRLDPGVAERLADALARHPWVARVERVEERPDGRVTAALAYRVPVLAVAEPARVVDRYATVLPQAASREGLPVLVGRLPAPGSPGQVWAEPRVKAAARVSHLLGPHLAELGLAGCRVEVAGSEVMLRTARAVVRWGSAPGKERAGEASAAEKLRRLRQGPAQDGQELDVRPANGALRRAVK